MTGHDAALGWPFLIARGRRRGYSVLLAPGFLIDDHDHGFLEDVAGPVPGSEPFRVAAATSPHGRRLSLVWSDHQVTADELADGSPPLDEHSRPLRLLAGFLTDAAVSHPSEVDTARARRAALLTYRRFLADEEHFTVEPSTPFGLRSTLVRSAPPQVPQPSPRPPGRRTVPMAVAGLAIAGFITIAAVSFGSSNSEPPPPPPACPTTTTTRAAPPVGTTTTTTRTTPPVGATTSAALPVTPAPRC